MSWCARRPSVVAMLNQLGARFDPGRSGSKVVTRIGVSCTRAVTRSAPSCTESCGPRCSRRTSRSWTHGRDRSRARRRGSSRRGSRPVASTPRARSTSVSLTRLPSCSRRAATARRSRRRRIPPTLRVTDSPLPRGRAPSSTNVEFVQFHPTVLFVADTRGQSPLITEALRGAGGVIVDDEGRSVMRGEHPLARPRPA